MLNPFAWKRGYQVALLIGALAGTGMGTAIPYFRHAQLVPFHFWLEFYWADYEFGWTILGAVLGAALVYARVLLAR